MLLKFKKIKRLYKITRKLKKFNIKTVYLNSLTIEDFKSNFVLKNFFTVNHKEKFWILNYSNPSHYTFCEYNGTRWSWTLMYISFACLSRTSTTLILNNRSSTQQNVQWQFPFILVKHNFSQLSLLSVSDFRRSTTIQRR